jgi:hypothetical protein
MGVFPDRNSEATVWVTEDGETRTFGLGRPTGLNTWASLVSHDRSTIVGALGQTNLQFRQHPGVFEEPFRWTEDTGLVRLGLLPGNTAGTPAAISADASVIVGNASNYTTNFLWDDVHGMHNLQSVLRTEHGLTPFEGWNVVNILGMTPDARTLVGSLNRDPPSGTADFQVFALFLDRPIHIRLSELASGDYNANALLDQADLNLVLRHWGAALPNPRAVGWVHNPPTGAVGQAELDRVVNNWPAAAGPLNLTLGATNGALNAKWDLKSNAAVLDHNGASPATTVRQQIISGRGGAGFGKPWNGPGIASSTAAMANATEPESRSIGYAENGAMPLGPRTTFHGQPVDDTSILIAFTRTGDANLDGVVNDDDVTIVGATYAPGVPNASWALGDFDYNGFVDDDDVTLLGAFYDPSAQPLLAPAPVASDTAIAAVPEPNAWALAVSALAVLFMVARRRITLSNPQL